MTDSTAEFELPLSKMSMEDLTKVTPKMPMPAKKGEPGYPNHPEDFLARRVNWSKSPPGQHFRNLQAKMLCYVIDEKESREAFRKMPVDLVAAYENTKYEVYLDAGDPSAQTIVLKLGERSEWLQNALVENKRSSGVYISGWNPFSTKTSPEKNSLANDLLLQTLLGEDCESVKIYRGRGISGDEDWFEESFLALGPYLGLARWLCQKFSQRAAIYFDGDAVPRLLIVDED